MNEIIAALAVLGAVGNVVLGAVLCRVTSKTGCGQDVRAPEDRERAAEGKARIISPYIDKEKRGDRR